MVSKERGWHKQITEKLIFFQFSSQKNKQKVLDNQSWHFDRFLFVLKWLWAMNNILLLNLPIHPFWLGHMIFHLMLEINRFAISLGNKVGEFIMEDLDDTRRGRFFRFRVLINLHFPLNAKNKEIAILLGNKVGEFIMKDLDDTRWGRFLRFRVVINLHFPLWWGIMVRSKNNQLQWVYFKYEYVPTSCYNYGCYGHFMKNYEKNLRRKLMSWCHDNSNTNLQSWES